MRKIVVLIVVLLVASLSGMAEDIIVRQDKDGTIHISNVPSRPYKHSKKRRNSVKGVTFIKSSPAAIPKIYLAKIKELAKKYRLKESLIKAVARAESGFNPFAVSRKGAVGIMQLMSDTARKYGVIDRYNADQNLEAGTRHLKYLYEKYNKNLRLTLAAYNAGEEAVKKYKGVPPFKETRNFIKRVMKFMGMSYAGYFNTKPSTKIYQYRNKDGKIIITDTFPSNAAGAVTVINK